MKYLLITDAPNPWREKVYEVVNRRFGSDFHVVYCAHREERRLWKFPLGGHEKTFLRNIRIRTGEKERWVNFGIIPLLLKNRPEIIICFGFQPTVMIAFLLGRLMKKKFAILSDTWQGRDNNISWMQRAIRKIAYNKFADAFIGASVQTNRMFKHYNRKAKPEQFFLSWLCADNENFRRYFENKGISRTYDIMFSGRIVETKNPVFFAEVAVMVRKHLGRCKALIIGEGEDKIKNRMFETLREGRVEYDFAGFIEHRKLPQYYGKSRLLLLPTAGDCWGVVINEALISGMPVITTDKTAAAGELVINEQNGYILPMDAELWANKVCTLLGNPDLLGAFSKAAIESVSQFTFDRAGEGIIAAIEFLDGHR